MKVVAVSGGFDPLHPGHIRFLKDASQLGRVVVILNNDNWVLKKKGFVFMPETYRKEVLEALKFVHEVIISNHKKEFDDWSVSEELESLSPDIFANGPEYTVETTLEREVAEKLGIKLIYGLGGGKVASSSELVKNYLK